MTGSRAPRTPSPPAAAQRAPEFKPPAAKPSEIIASETLPATTGGRGMMRTAAATAVPLAPIVPLVHVPDDPGPDAPQHLEPETETSPEPSSEGWRRLRGLFK